MTLLDLLEAIINDQVPPGLNYDQILSKDSVGFAIEKMNTDDLENLIYLATKIEAIIEEFSQDGGISGVCLRIIDENFGIDPEAAHSHSLTPLNGLLGFLAIAYVDLARDNHHPEFTPGSTIMPLLHLIKNLNYLSPFNEPWLLDSLVEFYIDQDQDGRAAILSQTDGDIDPLADIDDFFVAASAILDIFYEDVTDSLQLNHMSPARQLTIRYLTQLTDVVANMQSQFSDDDLDYRPVGLFIRNVQRYGHLI